MSTDSDLDTRYAMEARAMGAEMEITSAATKAGAAALKPYPIASSDRWDAASEVLQAAAPLIVAAELARLMDGAFTALDGSDLDGEEYEVGYRVLHDLVIERIEELAPHLRRASDLRREDRNG